MERRSETLVKNTLIMSLGTVCTKGIMFFMTPLFTRWLTQDAYGTFDLIISFITLLMPLITLGCGDAVFRFLVDTSKDDKDANIKKSIVTNALFVVILGFFITLFVISIIFYRYKPIQNLAFYFYILLLIETMNLFMIMVLRGLKKLPIYTIANMIYVFAMVISTIVLVRFFSLGLKGIILGCAIGYLASSCYMMVVSKISRLISIRCFDLVILKSMLKYSLPLMPNAIAWWIVAVSDRTLVSIILGTSYNAVLSVSHKLPNLCQTLFGVFHYSWQENATETIHDEDRDNYYSSIMNNLIVILISITSVVLCFNFLLFRYIFTTNYFGAYYLVPLLMLANVISMLAQFLGGIYTALKDTKKIGSTTVMAALVNLFIHLAMIRLIGLYAAPLSTLISCSVLFLTRYHDINKSIHLKFDKKSMFSLIMLLYFIASNYFNHFVLNSLNLILAICFFLFMNKSFISILLKNMTGRKKCLSSNKCG